MLARKTWPALKSCTHQGKPSGGEVNDHRSQLPDEVLLSRESERHKARVLELDDRLSRLPDHVLLSILSISSLEEVARTSVLSHRWKNLWRYFPMLEFENRKAINEVFSLRGSRKQSDHAIGQERSKFSRWVNQVVDQHLASVIDELRIKFDLDDSCQHHVDKWVVFAFRKQVKTLNLDFTPVMSRFLMREARSCTLPLKCCMPTDLPCNPVDTKHPLRSLCLIFVNVTAEQIGCLLHSCPFLENLCIERSVCLTSIRVSGSLLQLRHLDVAYCENLKSINISSPKLLSFSYFGCRLELRIGSVPSLIKLSVGGFYNDPIRYIFDSSNYFSQLEYLTLHIHSNELNLRINHAPALTHLRHLDLHVYAHSGQSFLGWTSLIEASPILEKLSFKLDGFNYPTQNAIIALDGRPLKCLRTLELGGFVGEKIDLEFATYVFKNAIMLEEVVVDFKPPQPSMPNCKGKEERVFELEKRLPPGVKLIIK